MQSHSLFVFQHCYFKAQQHQFEAELPWKWEQAGHWPVWHQETWFPLIFSTTGADSCCGLRHSMALQRTMLAVVQQGRLDNKMLYFWSGLYYCQTFKEKVEALLIRMFKAGFFRNYSALTRVACTRFAFMLFWISLSSPKNFYGLSLALGCGVWLFAQLTQVAEKARPKSTKQNNYGGEGGGDSWGSQKAL